MAPKREREASSPLSSEDIFFSAEIIEQTSRFIAAYSPTLPTKALQALPQFRPATHRMAAWRRRSKQQSLTPATKVIFDLGHDDDGEKWAGSRLQNVLADTQAEGVVVVARWYGGQNIGPIRFTHIENCAKQAIWMAKAAGEEAGKQHEAKKQRVEEDKVKQQLVDDLQERDLNILVLRKLLAGKKAQLEDSEPAPPTPQKAAPDYGKMSMDALQKLDKARDASIAFILKQIDRVDEELKLIEALDDAEHETWQALDEQSGTKADGPASTDARTEKT